MANVIKVLSAREGETEDDFGEVISELGLKSLKKKKSLPDKGETCKHKGTEG